MNFSGRFDATISRKYEVVFCVFLIGLTLLCRNNVHLTYPRVMYLLTGLLAINGLTGVSLRLWPLRKWLAAASIAANWAVITAIVAYSGGEKSNLWVLYLLPVYTGCLMLNGKEVVWVALGSVSFNVLNYAAAIPVWTMEPLFEIGLKSGILIFAAAITWRIASKERNIAERLESRDLEMEQLMSSLKSRESALSDARKMADVGLLTSGVVHDLKNVLTVILGMIELMRKDENIDPGMSPYIDRIHKSAKLCKSIASNFLGLAGDKDTEFVPSDINEIIGSALSLYRSIFVEHKIRVRTEFSKRLPSVCTSPSNLKRLLMNLMSNAKDAMPLGGTVVIRTENVPAYGNGGVSWVQVCVEDTGRGIPEEIMKNLFKPFRTTKFQNLGTGLGLSVSYEIAASHGGNLRAENRPEGGARFILRLPSCEKEPVVEMPEHREAVAY